VRPSIPARKVWKARVAAKIASTMSMANRYLQALRARWDDCRSERTVHHAERWLGAAQHVLSQHSADLAGTCSSPRYPPGEAEELAAGHCSSSARQAAAEFRCGLSGRRERSGGTGRVALAWRQVSHGAGADQRVVRVAAAAVGLQGRHPSAAVQGEGLKGGEVPELDTAVQLLTRRRHCQRRRLVGKQLLQSQGFLREKEHPGRCQEQPQWPEGHNLALGRFCHVRARVEWQWKSRWKIMNRCKTDQLQGAAVKEVVLPSSKGNGLC
jgi:hypothetical protein